ncbi:MAG: inositol monophosphatase family protein [Patescibacteria group bacterium]
MNLNNNFLEIALQAAKEAGNILMTYYGNTEEKFKNSSYDIGSVVTEADLASEKKIVEILKAAFPDHGFHLEENGIDNESAEYIWYIDPLDGTSNFVRSIPLFGISIGLAQKGVPILGVLYFPALNLLVHATKDQGAFANNKKIEVSKRPLEKTLYYSGGKFNGKMLLNQALVNSVAMIKIIDSSSYEFAQIAMGNAEIYSLINIPHDVVAGVCIVREAGGKVTDGSGKPWAIHSDTILATNGIVHDQVLKLIQTQKD